jgi:hypothetical protein
VVAWLPGRENELLAPLLDLVTDLARTTNLVGEG